MQRGHTSAISRVLFGRDQVDTVNKFDAKENIRRRYIRMYMCSNIYCDLYTNDCDHIYQPDSAHHQDC